MAILYTKIPKYCVHVCPIKQISTFTHSIMNNPPVLTLQHCSKTTSNCINLFFMYTKQKKKQSSYMYIVDSKLCQVLVQIGIKMNSLILSIQKKLKSNVTYFQFFTCTIIIIMSTIYIQIVSSFPFLLYTCIYSHPKTQSLALNYILKFISHKASFKDIYREAGILTLLINALKAMCDEFKKQTDQTGI